MGQIWYRSLDPVKKQRFVVTSFGQTGFRLRETIFHHSKSEFRHFKLTSLFSNQHFQEIVLQFTNLYIFIIKKT